jgi:hypothetical protein
LDKRLEGICHFVTLARFMYLWGCNMNTTDQHDEARQGEALVLEGTQGAKKLYLESYGCQMNFSDSEIVASLLQKEGYETTNSLEEADLVLLNTCSIRDKAEQTIRKRLEQFNGLKARNADLKIGVLGCMAERVREKFFEEEKLQSTNILKHFNYEGDHYYFNFIFVLWGSIQSTVHYSIHYKYRRL